MDVILTGEEFQYYVNADRLVRISSFKDTFKSAQNITYIFEGDSELAHEIKKGAKKFYDIAEPEVLVDIVSVSYNSKNIVILGHILDEVALQK